MDEFHDRKVIITYNGIIGRPRIREFQAVPSTAHVMLKFLVDGGIVTIRSTILIPAKCATVTTSSKETPKEDEVRQENFKVALHLNFPDQEVTIGGSLSAKERIELCSLTKRNLDIFAWQLSNMTGVPRSVAEHQLILEEGYSPVRQKKRGQAPERAKAIQAEVTTLNTRRTHIQKQPELLLCLVGLSRRYFLGDDVYPTFLQDDDRDMDLFNLISAPNPTKVKTGTRPRAAHKETVASEIPPSGNVSATRAAPEVGLEKEVAAIGPLVSKKRHKRGNDGADANAPPKVLKKDHAASRPTQSTIRGKSLASIGLEAGSTFSTPAPHETPADVSDPNPLSYAKPQSTPERDIAKSSKGAAVARDPDSEKSSSFTSLVGSPGSIYQPRWGVTNNCRLDTSDYNINLARQVTMGSQLRLRFEQEIRLQKRATERIARRDQRIQAREEEIKKLEQEINSLRAMDTEAKNANLTKKLESLRTQLSDLQVNNNQLSQQCAEMDERLDDLSINFDEELYPHILTAIAGRRWVIGHGLRLAVMKCAESTKLRQVFVDVVSARIAKGMSEGLKHGIEHRKANLDLEAIEAYDPEADTKYVAALRALRDLKYPMVDQLENLKDAPIDVVMASLHLESDSREDAP
ncbi:hypothetical protein Tco_0855695 [Tanacetum coccineum]